MLRGGPWMGMLRGADSRGTRHPALPLSARFCAFLVAAEPVAESDLRASLLLLFLAAAAIRALKPLDDRFGGCVTSGAAIVSEPTTPLVRRSDISTTCAADCLALDEAAAEAS